MATFTQVCKHCATSFPIDEVDQAFYEKMGVPAPTLCPPHRQQRRMVWRNERTLYHRKCDLCGKQSIAMYPNDSSMPVYCAACWWSDKWDELEHGMDFDFSRPFFDQFRELKMKVPHMGLANDSTNVNSEYTNQTTAQKDCYLVFDSDACEGSFYLQTGKHSKSCMDGFRVFFSELCYECLDCENCYNCFYAQDCDGCVDSFFLQDCKSCRNCFGCVGLRNKEYCFYNEQLSKEEYEKRIAEMNLGSFSKREEVKRAFQAWKLNFPVKSDHNIFTEDSLGDYLKRSKNSQYCFDSEDLEDCRYCTDVGLKAKDCHDYDVWGDRSELIYNCITVGENTRNVAFSATCWGQVQNLRYCEFCMHASDLFGCISLKNKKYCILNKQYSKEEYEALVPRIVEHMKKTGEWGEFFPASLSFFGYNETPAQDYFPLTKESAVAQGFKWKDEDLTQGYQGPDFVLPDRIEEVGDEILKQILKCEVTGKFYKIIPQELAYYRKMGVPVPRRCPDQRHSDRIRLRNPRLLWQRPCMNCAQNVLSSYSPERPEKVFCEPCYLKTIY